MICHKIHINTESSKLAEAGVFIQFTSCCIGDFRKKNQCMILYSSIINIKTWFQIEMYSYNIITF